jgi:hypothetical protein
MGVFFLISTSGARATAGTARTSGGRRHLGEWEQTGAKSQRLLSADGAGVFHLVQLAVNIGGGHPVAHGCLEPFVSRLRRPRLLQFSLRHVRAGPERRSDLGELRKPGTSCTYLGGTGRQSSGDECAVGIRGHLARGVMPKIKSFASLPERLARLRTKTTGSFRNRTATQLL